MTTEEISSRIAAIGRPALTSLRQVLDKNQVARIRHAQNEWDLAHPELAAEHAQLMRDLGAIEDAAQAVATAKAEAGRSKANLRRIAGDRVADALDAPEALPPLLSAKEWWATESWCLALIGDLGVGKSVGAGFCAREALAAGKHVIWIDARESALSPIFGLEGSQRARAAREAYLLVVDDFGAEGGTAAWLAWLDSVLSVRHARNRRTVITSNASTLKFRELVGPRMADRIREGGVVRDFGGESLRKRRSA
jgi:hypothetical protein